MKHLLAVALLIAVAAPAHAESAAPAVPPSTPPDLVSWLGATGLLASHTVDATINPFYLRGDFDGDGKADYVVSLIDSSGADPNPLIVAVLAPKSKQGKPRVAAFPHDDTPARDGWYVHDRKRKVAVGVTGGKPPRLKGDAVMIWKAESSSAIVYWNGKKMTTYWQGD